MSNHCTVTGAIGRGVELRFTPSGQAVANMSIGDTPRRKDEQGNWVDAGETLWIEVTAWGDLAEQLAEAHGPDTKGRATAVGTLGCRYWEAKDGAKRMQVTLRADAVMIHAHKSTRGQQTAPAGDPWKAQGQSAGGAVGKPPYGWADGEEPPFVAVPATYGEWAGRTA